ncbi:hypothetical protein N7468_006917 [Penicillium chermesinum]|uniref:Uncharacterized protein n=1 Tax=Penicillium chermesinum TaxID=63820 RepID=A0A9W9TK22_9EURO|nr:uncharacterized protein N7468_006917 [Penicillium chermesinum]KAJ5225692.1 hypothetical protein N7468_006917 [Penicillium chermesinum]
MNICTYSASLLPRVDYPIGQTYQVASTLFARRPRSLLYNGINSKKELKYIEFPNHFPSTRDHPPASCGGRLIVITITQVATETMMSVYTA